MIDDKSFKAFEKAAKDSFFKQKNMIKQVLAGKTVRCQTCNKPIVFTPPTQDKAGTVHCALGCTDVELDMS